MFIELTDHLRCPEAHEEAYLVLLPERMRDRMVIAGHLGCPVCGGAWAVRDGIADFGPGDGGRAETTLTADAIHAFLGLSGPGGYVALIGGPAGLAPRVAPLLGGVHLVLVNPPAPPGPELPMSVLRAPRLPLKTASLRGAVVGKDLGEGWIRDAIRATLPGLRVVGEGAWPEIAGAEPMASAPGVWVARTLRTG